MTTPYFQNTYPYSENYFFSIERELAMNTVLSVSYVGAQAHHLLLVGSSNPGNPALCLALSKPEAVAPNTPTCGPYAEDATYITRDGRTIEESTRGPFGPNFSNNAFQKSTGNSNYNSLQVNLRRSHGRTDLMFSYTYSKSIDQASSISDVVDPYNNARMRSLSNWDLKHNFVATYTYQLPLELISERGPRS